jgi:hypothetical protein
MPRRQSHRAKKDAAARARECRARLRLALQEIDIIHNRKQDPEAVDCDTDDTTSICSWDGGVNSWSDVESELAEWVEDEELNDNRPGMSGLEGNEGSASLDVEEIEGDELEKNLERNEDLKQARLNSVFALIMGEKTLCQWKDIEKTRMGGYNGLSERTKRSHKQQARKKEEEDAKIRQTYAFL